MQHRLARSTFLVALLLFAAPARADDVPWRLSIDTDPTTYPLGGFSGWAMVKPARTEHLRVGIGGFGLDFPSFLVPHLERTGADGWSLGVRGAFAFGGYVLGDRRGLYIGAYAGYLESRHGRDDMPGRANAHNIAVLPCIGYQWFPFARGALRGAYLQPWAGAIAWTRVAGTSTLGGREFKDPRVIPLAAFHIGYEF